MAISSTNPPIEGKLPIWAKDHPEYVEWMFEARLKQKYGYSVSELENMDHNHYLFLVTLLEADALKEKKEREKMEKDAKNKRRH
jgi:hypothetical protein